MKLYLHISNPSVKKVFLAIMLVLLAMPQVWAHGSNALPVSGVVTDDSGQPMSGVSVMEKGTRNGTTTGDDGTYRISINDQKAILVFTYAGFLSKEETVNEQLVVNTSLARGNETLNSVVVVGYGTQKKINLTGAVGSVSGDFIKDRPITNVSQALQGAVSGVFVNQNSGRPGEDGANIRIRGIGTLNNTSPLVLVDGIEAPIDNVDPNDIASISVLKDAASASIYGSRASNGVLLITTKRGRANTRPTISYNGYYGGTEATVLPKMITNSAQFMELRNEADVNAGLGASFTDEEIAFYKTNGPNTNWIDEFFGRGAVQSHNVSINGGGGTTRYMLSLGNLNQTGITPKERFNRYTVRLNLDSKLFDKLSVGVNMFLANGTQKSPSENLVASGGGDGVVARTIAAVPLFPAFTETGHLAGMDQSFENATKFFTHPYVQSELNTFKGIRNQLLGTAFAEYELIRDLKIKGTLAVNYQTNDGESFARLGYIYDWRTDEIIPPAFNSNRDRNVYHNQRSNITSWLQATYQKSFGDHNLDFLAGINKETSRYTGFGAGRINLPSNAVPILNTGNPSTATNFENATEWGLLSYFGRVNYNYNETYLLEFNVRRDGSSKFGANNRFATFPSVSAGWILTKEKFLENIKPLNLLKLRASWGQLGNQNALGSNYPFAAQVSLNTNYVLNGTVVPGAAQTTFANAGIRWETTTSTDVGIDVGLFNKLTIEADYFIRKASDILYAVPLPATAGGLENPVINTAEVENRGWELAAAYKEKIGDFSFQVGFNVTNVNSKVLQINAEAEAEKDQVISGNKILKRGVPINAIYGLKAIGIFQNAEEVDKAPTQFGDYGPGDLIYEDIDGNGEINDMDRTVIGREDPRWLYGANMNASYKGFDLSAVVSGVSNYQSYGNSEFYEPYFNNNGTAAQWLNRWTPDNPTNFPRLYYGSGPNFTRANSFWVLDRSFIRLKNLQVGYTLPASLLAKAKIQRARIYLNAQNLLTNTDFIGFDPERIENTSRGGDGYPNLKIISAGLTLTF